MGYNSDGEVICSKEILTAGPPSKIELIPDRSTILSDGTDLSFITVKITDSMGNLCPEAENLVHFTIEGEGALGCVGNGDPACIESYQENSRSAIWGSLSRSRPWADSPSKTERVFGAWVRDARAVAKPA